MRDGPNRSANRRKRPKWDEFENRKALSVSADAAVARSVGGVVDKTIAELGGVHLLINNAGALLSKSLLQRVKRNRPGNGHRR